MGLRLLRRGQLGELADLTLGCGSLGVTSGNAFGYFSRRDQLPGTTAREFPPLLAVDLERVEGVAVEPPKADGLRPRPMSENRSWGNVERLPLHRECRRVASMKIKGRAVRRMGELLKEIEPGNKQDRGGGRPSREGNIREGKTPDVSRSAIAQAAGLSVDQAKQAIRVANIPRREFERLIDAEAPPTPAALAARAVDSFALRSVAFPTFGGASAFPFFLAFVVAAPFFCPASFRSAASLAIISAAWTARTARTARLSGLGMRACA